MFEGLREYILKNLQRKVTEKGLYDYQTFGKEVETEISDLIEDFLNLKQTKYNVERAKDKNDFPDLKITIDDEEYAFEYKAGESSKGPSNDMGTLKAYSEKIEKFEDRIFCIFIKYSKDTKKRQIIIENVFIAKIYEFIGILSSSSRDDILKYRKKDGNLRPKVWKDFDQDKVYINNLNDFKIGINETISYRANELVLEHIDDLKYEDAKKIYNKLQSQIQDKDK